jgi:hypothetical protein
MPLVAIHQHYMPNGKVLMFGRGDLGDYAMLWDPTANTYESIGSMGVDVFCAGHSILSDGTVFMAGGHVIDGWGLKDTLVYDPFAGPTGTWRRKPDMVQPRWYPTCTTMPDGRVLTVSGSMSLNPDSSKNWADAVEVFDPESGTWAQYGSDTSTRGYYRFMHVLPNGGVYYAGSTIWHSRLFNPATNTWGNFGTPSSEVYGMSSVSYLPGKILKSGGPKNQTNLEGSTWSAVFDGTVANPVWTTTAPMAFERREHDLTVLPDGTVLSTGGSLLYNVPQTAIFEAELFDPANNSWTTLPRMVTPRSYHSSAFLLRDGRVVVAGGGNGGGRRPNATQDYMSCEIYSPGYLFRGSRPVITEFPKVLGYSESVTVSVNDPASIRKVALIAPSSVTHGYDMNQRYVPMAFSVVAGKLQVQAPAHGGFAPPGPYMLFVLNDAGVPSIGEFVFVSERLAPVAPSTFSCNVPSSGGLSSLTSSDNVYWSPTSSGSKAPMPRLTITGVSPRRFISTLAFEMESTGSTDPFLIEAYNYDLDRWDTIGSGFEVEGDTARTWTVAGSASRYVDQESREVSCRITWGGVVTKKIVRPRVDLVRWIVTR